jgi:hypothetical protein
MTLSGEAPLHHGGNEGGASSTARRLVPQAVDRARVLCLMTWVCCAAPGCSTTAPSMRPGTPASEARKEARPSSDLENRRGTAAFTDTARHRILHGASLVASYAVDQRSMTEVVWAAANALNSDLGMKPLKPTPSLERAIEELDLALIRLSAKRRLMLTDDLVERGLSAITSSLGDYPRRAIGARSEWPWAEPHRIRLSSGSRPILLRQLRASVVGMRSPRSMGKARAGANSPS